MAEKEQPRQPTHRVYSVTQREGQDDSWLNIGLVFAHQDGDGFNLMLQAFPLDGKIVCRAINSDEGEASPPSSRWQHSNTDRMGRASQKR